MHGFFTVGQIISPLIHLPSTNGFEKLAQLSKIVSTSLLFIVLLTSCSSQAPQKKATKQPVTAKAQPQESLTAEQTVALAQGIMANGANDEIINESIRILSSASQLHFQEKNYNKAAWLAEQTLQLVSNSANEGNTETSQQPLPSTELVQLMLIKAKSYQALNYTELSYEELEIILSFSKQHDLTLTFDFHQLRSEILQTKNRVIASLQARLYALSLDTQQNIDSIEEENLLLWQDITALSPWQVELLSKRTAPNLVGWLQLNQYANKFGGNAKQLSRYLTHWQRQYQNHPANSIAIQLLQQKLTQKEIESIAVLLPLTGRQKNAAIAIQQGILAGLEQDIHKNNTEKNIQFFDSNIVDWQNLPTKFTEQNIDFVIGPLLKANIDKYLQLSLTSTVDAQPEEGDTNEIDREVNNIPAKYLPTLFLNFPNQQKLTVNQTAFSMRPEDEAIQAAATLSQVGFEQAIVLSHQDKVSQRIALAFVKEWQEKTNQELEVVYFEQGKSMQDNLKESLDVKESQSRINELQSRLKQTIKAQTRNRRDIDMIYVVGSAQQTRLVKPYIDVNISPFSALIPIYASSRSHSILNDVSSANDLQGLTFTEIPWLLKSAQQNKSLAKLSAQLWPRRQDSLSRIFAMGFDSYNLIDKVSLMQQAPYIRYFGQTGVLQLNNNILSRSFIWGRYQTKGVSQVTLH